MNLRVFLDANVLFTAAHNRDGLSRLLFELRRNRVFDLLSSPHAVEEAQTNLQIKFPNAVGDFQKLTGLLELVDPPAPSPASVNLPEDDLLIFSAAVAGRATHLLTGDQRHFGPYFNKPDRTAGVRIQTVRRFFEDRFSI